MNANDKLTIINQHIDNGSTIVVSTCTNAWKVDKKVAARFAKINRPVFKVIGASLFMTSGNKYVCIDFCTIKTFS